MKYQSQPFLWRRFIILNLTLTSVCLVEWSIGFPLLTFALAYFFLINVVEFEQLAVLFYLSFLLASLFLVNWPLILLLFLSINFLIDSLQRYHFKWILILLSLLSSAIFISLAQIQLQPSSILLLILELLGLITFLPSETIYD